MRNKIYDIDSISLEYALSLNLLTLTNQKLSMFNKEYDSM